jgi:mannitol/fructose-specific phosphotransferase system IIA component (Ntr-type)
MIAELLEPAKVVRGLKGDFNRGLELLCRRSRVPHLSDRLRNGLATLEEERYSYIGQGIAVPHLRVENLGTPEIILGLAPEGLLFNGQRVKVVLLLVTPAEQPAQHLQLLQRIGSLLPTLRDELLAQRDPARVLQTVARAAGLRLSRRCRD